MKWWEGNGWQEQTGLFLEIEGAYSEKISFKSMKSKYQNGTNQNLQKLKKISKNLDDWRI